MIDKPQRKDAVILQQAWQIGPFADMLRLTYQRHAAYAWAHNMEYIAWAGSLKPANTHSCINNSMSMLTTVPDAPTVAKRR
jgi:hypothetical protein